MKGKIRYVLVGIVSLLIIGEIIFLLVITYKHKNVSKQANTALSLFQQNVPGLYLTPPGYYVTFTDNESFMLLGQINAITRATNGDIFANVSFALNKAQGPVVHQQFLLFTKSHFIPAIFLTKAKVFTLSVPTNARKTFTLDPIKDPTTTLQTLQKYTKQKAMLTLNTGFYPPDMAAVAKKLGDIIGQLYHCNRLLLDTLDTNTPLPSCTPYVSQLIVYDKNY